MRSAAMGVHLVVFAVVQGLGGVADEVDHTVSHETGGDA